MKKVLATAYAVNPYKGSEDGMGWNMIYEIAKYHKVIAITRENNQAAIEQYQQENPSPIYDNMEFAYFDLPYWMRFWKKGGRGAMLYYYMWQYGIVNFIKKKKIDFDIAHNLNFHNDWTPSFLWKLGKPMVWGPVGHHPVIPKDYLAVYGKRALLKDRITWALKNFFWKYDPFLNLTKHRAKRILAMNNSVKNVLGVAPEKFYKLPSVGSEKIEQIPHRANHQFTILSVGRFVPLKGFDIVIRSFAMFYHQLSGEERINTKLVLVGKGPQEQLLKHLVSKHKIGFAVQFIPWIERAALLKIYRDAKLFFFPSHEGAGMVVVEAMSMGLPVLCFDNCGPGEIIDEKSGIKIPYSNYEESIQIFAEKLQWFYKNTAQRKQFGVAAQQRHKENFLWETKATAFKEIYQTM